LMLSYDYQMVLNMLCAGHGLHKNNKSK